MADSNDSSASAMIVALVAILVIVAIGFLIYRQMQGVPTSNPSSNINVTVPVPTGNSSTGI